MHTGGNLKLLAFSNDATCLTDLNPPTMPDQGSTGGGGGVGEVGRERHVMSGALFRNKACTSLSTSKDVGCSNTFTSYVKLHELC